MLCPSILPASASPSQKQRRRGQRGLTLVEIMISLGVLAVTSVGGVSAFLLLNRYAAVNRCEVAAKELCQERIDQAQTMIFTPVTNTPIITGQTVNGTLGAQWKILGASYNLPGTNTHDPSSPYDNNGNLLSASTITTSTEPVNVYLQQETGTTVIAGTRTTTVGLPTNLTDISTNNQQQLKIIQFTVTVTFAFRGQNFSYSMYTLRGND